MDVIALGACIIAAQLVMVVVASLVGRTMRAGVGRKKIFLVALAILPIRGVLFSLTTSPYAVVGIQLLDGVAAGIFGVVAVVIASDLMISGACREGWRPRTKRLALKDCKFAPRIACS
ncbi:hypothetical protein PQR75_44825 [Paraburkholderia fungorum]|jgi:hypothetical protein|uniref:hypothetical protein n=1 Tax=Paraburkholderia fungorum TaxID=134537 RepID=UPI0038BBAFCF